ncbi:MAG TPA: exosortase system-associated protein, TIGR04073 family [Methylococcus sp.]|nr:exosortase system-associated protein, TIGR04073 family [Methylococcus sp.]
MNIKCKGIKRAASLTLMLGLASGTAFGDGWEDYAGDVGDKLGRGLANATLGWVELVKGVGIAASDEGPAFIPFGFFEGIGDTLGRTVAGAFEVVTFPIPHAPLTDPVYVWDDFDRDTRFGYFDQPTRGKAPQK